MPGSGLREPLSCRCVHPKQRIAQALGKGAVLVWTCLWLGLPGRSLAQGGAAQGSVAGGEAGRTSYETRRLRKALGESELVEASDAQGKPIAFIRVLRRDVLAADELFPDLPRQAKTWRFAARRHHASIFNALHVMTREEIIRRELTFSVGQPFDWTAVRETMRNLRSLGIFALVRIVPVEAAQGQVGVAVFTRDLWSLRLETPFAGTTESFAGSIQLTESNLLGLNKRLTVSLGLKPFTYTIGESFSDRRLLGGTLRLLQSGELIHNRETGELEGGELAAELGQPFYTLAQTWAFTLSASYRSDIFRGVNRIIRVNLSDQADCPGCSCDPASPDCVPLIYERRQWRASAGAEYRTGTRIKWGAAFGFAFQDFQVTPSAEAGLRPDQLQAFAAVMPPSRRLAYPFVTYRLFEPRFVRFEDLGTFGQTENLRVGPLLQASVSVPLRLFGSDRDAMAFSGTLGYTLAGADAMLDLRLVGESRLERGQVMDQVLRPRILAASPHFGVGRLVLRAQWLAQRRDSDQGQVLLDATNGLRGVRTSSTTPVAGGSYALANVEFRSLPWVVEFVHVGGVLFYDVGTVYQELAQAELRHNVGIGLRALFPQFNRYVFRLDFGVPVGDEQGFRFELSFASAQLFGLTASERSSIEANAN